MEEFVSNLPLDSFADKRKYLWCDNNVFVSKKGFKTWGIGQKFIFFKEVENVCGGDPDSRSGAWEKEWERSTIKRGGTRGGGWGGRAAGGGQEQEEEEEEEEEVGEVVQWSALRGSDNW